MKHLTRWLQTTNCLNKLNKPLIAGLALSLIFSLASPVYATGSLNREAGFAQTMDGPSVKPLSERLVRDPSGNDTFYQDCGYRIGGYLVGRNTAAITDADGTHNINGLYRTFVHNAGILGKFTLTLRVRPLVGEVGFAPPVRISEEPVTEAVLKAYPDISNLVRDTNGNIIPGYKIQSVSTDVYKELTDPALMTQFKGKGIYRDTERVHVRCTFLIAPPTPANPSGDLIRCIHCFFFFGE